MTRELQTKLFKISGAIPSRSPDSVATFLAQGVRRPYLPAGTQTLFADAISAFGTFVEMLTLCSPAFLRGIA